MRLSAMTIALMVLLCSPCFVFGRCEVVPGEVLVKFTGEVPLDHLSCESGFLITGISSLDWLSQEYGICEVRPAFRSRPSDQKTAHLFNELGLNRIYLLKSWYCSDPWEMARTYATTPYVEYAEPNFIGEGHATRPNDPRFGEQWALENTGNNAPDPSHGGSPKAGADIDAPKAWGLGKGSDGIVVGILDSGIDWNHPDLDARIWLNADDPINGVDDDKNGYKDDYRGWDFVNNDNNPMDDHGHGTVTAGIVGAETNNNNRIAGVDWNGKLMACKVLYPWGGGTRCHYLDVVEAIEYAVDNGAHVINLSLGFDADSANVLWDAADYAYRSCVSVVASMGNHDSYTPRYPAGFYNVVAVGATDTDDWRADPFSWGGGSAYGWHIDLVAPGNNILSTIWNDSTAIWSGTSFSAPHVSGTLALLRFEGLTSFQAERQIWSRTEDRVGKPSEDLPGWDQYHGYGRLNAFYAMVIPDVILMLFPDDTTQIYHRGDTLSYMAAFEPFELDTAVTVYYWAEVTFPNGSKKRVYGPQAVEVDTNFSPVLFIEHVVPNNAPYNTFTYAGYIGYSSTKPFGRDWFRFKIAFPPEDMGADPCSNRMSPGRLRQVLSRPPRKIRTVPWNEEVP